MALASEEVNEERVLGVLAASRCGSFESVETSAGIWECLVVSPKACPRLFNVTKNRRNLRDFTLRNPFTSCRNKASPLLSSLVETFGYSKVYANIILLTGAFPSRVILLGSSVKREETTGLKPMAILSVCLQVETALNIRVGERRYLYKAPWPGPVGNGEKGDGSIVGRPLCPFC